MIYIIILGIVSVVAGLGAISCYSLSEHATYSVEGIWMAAAVTFGILSVLAFIGFLVFTTMYIQAVHEKTIINSHFGTAYTAEQLMFASDDIYYILRKEHDTRAESDVNLNIKGLEEILK